MEVGVEEFFFVIVVMGRVAVGTGRAQCEGTRDIISIKIHRDDHP